MATPIVNIPVSDEEYAYLTTEMHYLVDTAYSYTARSNTIENYLVTKGHKDESTKLSDFKRLEIFQVLLTLFTSGLCNDYNVCNILN